MTGFKFTNDQLLALKLIGGAVKNLLLFGGWGWEVLGRLGGLG